MRSRFAFIVTAVLALSVSATSFAASSKGHGANAATANHTDANRDGSLTENEVTPEQWAVIRAADTDNDGVVTAAEMRAARHSQ